MLGRSLLQACGAGNLEQALTDGDALGVNGTQIAVLKQVNNEVFCGLDKHKVCTPMKAAASPYIAQGLADNRETPRQVCGVYNWSSQDNACVLPLAMQADLLQSI